MSEPMTDQHSSARVVPAPLDEVLRLLRTPSRHPETDPSGMVVGQVGDDPVVAVGDVFTMDMRFPWEDGSVAEYRTDNHVDVLEVPGPDGDGSAAVGWRTAAVGEPPFGWAWRYDLAPIDGEPGRTRVTLTYDWSGATDEVRERYGVPAFSPDDLAASLRSLEQALTGS